MAYTPKSGLEDDEQQQQIGASAPSAPTVAAPSIGSTPAVGGTAVGSSAASGSKTGTGFTNIDRVLGANVGASGMVKNRADEALSKDSAAFGKEAATVQDNVTKQKVNPVDPNRVVEDVTMSSGGWQQMAIDTAKDLITKQFQGPSTVDYGIGTNDEARRAQALGNAQSAGKQVAKDNNTLSNYGTGLQAIDAAIYGSQQESPTLQKVAEQTKGQVEGQISKKGTIEAEAGKTAKAIEDQGKAVYDAFTNQSNKYINEAKAQADAANAAEAAARANRPQAYQAATPERQAPGSEDFLGEGEVDPYYTSDANTDAYFNHIMEQFVNSKGYAIPESEKKRIREAAARDTPEKRKYLDEMWEKSAGGNAKPPGARFESYAGLNEQQRSRLAQLQKQYPNLKRDALFRLAQVEDPKSPSPQEYQWREGSGPASMENFVSADQLNVIGKVLGDDYLTNLKRGGQYKAGEWYR